MSDVNNNKRPASPELDPLHDELVYYVKKRAMQGCALLPEMTSNEKEMFLTQMEAALKKNVERDGIIVLDIQFTDDRDAGPGYLFARPCEENGDVRFLGNWWESIMTWQKQMEQERVWIETSDESTKALPKFYVQYAEYRSAIFVLIRDTWNDRHPRMPGEWIGGIFCISSWE
jgi:hypothetical protein